MVHIELIRNTYGGLSFLRNACNYVINEHNPVFVGGLGVDYRNVDTAYAQMVAVKKYFGKLTCNPLIHFVVSFDLSVQDQDVAIAYAKGIALFFHQRFQLLFAVHHKVCENSLYHVHFVVNSVSLLNGLLFHSSPLILNAFCQHVAKITGLKPYSHFDNKAKTDYRKRE